MRFTFGEVTIDCGRRQLLRAGEEQHLSAKAFALLELLLQRRPNAVKREEIFEHIWPNTFVAPSNVASLAQEIRDALADDARRPRFLRTIFGYGYAFIADEEQPGANTSTMRLVIGTTHLELPEGETILGRRVAPLAADHGISRDHARVVVRGDRGTIEDLGSKNGTFVGGRQIDAPTELVDGDEITIGGARLVFRSSIASDSTITAARAGIARP